MRDARAITGMGTALVALNACSVRQVAAMGRAGSIRCPSENGEGVSMNDESMTGTFQVSLPKDLLSEARRLPGQAAEQKLRVDGWRDSWLSRFSELLVGKS